MATRITRVTLYMEQSSFSALHQCITSGSTSRRFLQADRDAVTQASQAASESSASMAVLRSEQEARSREEAAAAKAAKKRAATAAATAAATSAAATAAAAAPVSSAANATPVRSAHVNAPSSGSNRTPVIASISTLPSCNGSSAGVGATAGQNTTPPSIYSSPHSTSSGGSSHSRPAFCVPHQGSSTPAAASQWQEVHAAGFTTAGSSSSSNSTGAGGGRDKYGQQHPASPLSVTAMAVVIPGSRGEGRLTPEQSVAAELRAQQLQAQVSASHRKHTTNRSPFAYRQGVWVVRMAQPVNHQRFSATITDTGCGLCTSINASLSSLEIASSLLLYGPKSV